MCRNESRFNFAKSVDPVKKDGAIGGFKFGFGANFSERDKDEILVPLKVQELIHRNIRTLSNSMSNRSPEEVWVHSQHSLIPVLETDLEELEHQWYTLEEKASSQKQEAYPFRKFKDKEVLTQQVANNLDVKRVKYNNQQTMSGEKMSPEEES